MILGRWREASSALAITYEDDWASRVELPAPNVIVVSDKTCSQLEDWLFDGILRRQGYRFVERLPSLRASQYVRPLPLWLLHRAGVFLIRMYWGALNRLYRAGLIHFAKDEGVIATWRDIRPGRLR